MDLNSINANINRLLTNIWAVISFLKEFLADDAKDVSITYINVDGSESVKTFPNIAKQYATFETWKGTVISKNYLPTSENYLPIVKFNSSDLVSSFRLVIGGTTTGFVYGGVFDVLSSHFNNFEIVNIASSAYGEINLRVSYDVSGNGYIELKRNTGDIGVINMQITLIPYVGSAIAYTGTVPTLNNVVEYTFS